MIIGDTPQTFWARVSLFSALAGEHQDAGPKVWYDMLEMYYLNNGLYDAVAAAYYDDGSWIEGMKPLRNPANRVVEFHVAKLWPGALPDALPILTENERILDPIQKIWAWSNWGSQKQVAARWYANLGDWFAKVVRHTNDQGVVDQVYFQQIKPQHVTDFEEDNRGHITEIRLDYSIDKAENGKTFTRMYTEHWDKKAGLYRTWEHVLDENSSLSSLGEPTTQQTLAELGIDFVPFGHAKFRDVGEKRGLGAYVHALDKIDEVNRQATRLHQMLFRYNKAIWALEANAQDSTGRPLPPPRVSGSTGPNNEGSTLELGDDALISLPGMSKLVSMVPDINYDAALKILQDQMRELEYDLPEMAYYRVREAGGQLSGRAVRLMLSDAIDRAIEARTNAETVLAQVNKMALPVGANAGLFPNIGTYENGDFEHSFRARPVIEQSEFEAAETMRSETQAGVPVVTSARRAGWSDAEIKQMAEDRAAEQKAQQESLAGAMMRAQANFDANGARE